MLSIVAGFAFCNSPNITRCCDATTGDAIDCAALGSASTFPR
jgi:hypothetical protein